jgi:hypothetical protein
MLASVAGAAEVFVLDTGHAMGPNVLDPGVPTPVKILISKSASPTTPLRIGGIVFVFEDRGFTDPDGHLDWDLDGLDNASNPTWFPTAEQILDFQGNPGFVAPRDSNVNDDGFWFAGILDGTLAPSPVAGDGEDPLVPYFALHNPAQTGQLNGGTSDAFRINANQTVQVATLVITAEDLGREYDEGLVLGRPDQLLVNAAFAVVDVGGSENQVLHVTPEPATLALLVLGGGLTVLRRRR